MVSVILASASPRRKALLDQVGVACRVVPSRVPEEIRPGEAPRAAARRLALDKARDVAGRVSSGLVVAADTLVVRGRTILGKPRDRSEAEAMLTALSGRWHEVVTAVAVKDSVSGREARGEEVTRVCFRSLSPETVRAYVASGEADDKAGAYGIQGRGALLVRGIRGCYTNVVGLPLGLLAELTARLGLPLLPGIGSRDVPGDCL